MAVSDWDTNPDNNNTLEGVNVAEGSLPKDLNDTFRKICAALKSLYLTTYGGGKTVTIQASGGAAPATPAEGDIWAEY